MNIEIANRLVELRKSNSLSQEALAEKLGISRQAVSKWERAEASPDTDNLIMLARLYGVSLDELLKSDEDVEVVCPVKEGEPVVTESEESTKETMAEPEMDAERADEKQQDDYVDLSLGGLHVKDKDGSEVHVSWDGVHVDDKKRGTKVDVGKSGVYVNGEKYERNFIELFHFPFVMIIVVVYIVAGAFWNTWHPGWLLFLLIPIWSSFLEAIKARNPNVFAYPVLATLFFLMGGFFLGAWHPGWVVFLTIPVYYSFASVLHSRWKRREEDEYEE